MSIVATHTHRTHTYLPLTWPPSTAISPTTTIGRNIFRRPPNTAASAQNSNQLHSAATVYCKLWFTTNANDTHNMFKEVQYKYTYIYFLPYIHTYIIHVCVESLQSLVRLPGWQTAVEKNSRKWKRHNATMYKDHTIYSSTSVHTYMLSTLYVLYIKISSYG